MLAPKRVKHRKTHKGKMRGKATRGNTVAFGEYGLQAQEAAWISNRQIEAARVAMTRHIKRGGKVWIRIFPDKPITAEARRDPHGEGQGEPRGLGGRGEARPNHVRAGGRVARAWPTGPWSWPRRSFPSRPASSLRESQLG